MSRVFLFVDYDRALNNLVLTAFSLFDMEDRRINSLHYFARFSFISKCENAKWCNEIEEKIIWLLYLTLREVSRNAGFI